jgi:hypothetical protein
MQQMNMGDATATPGARPMEPPGGELFRPPPAALAQHGDQFGHQGSQPQFQMPPPLAGAMPPSQSSFPQAAPTSFLPPDGPNSFPGQSTPSEKDVQRNKMQEYRRELEE